VGLVVAINPSLDGVNAVVEIRDEATVIPRRGAIVANQSGLAGEPLVDTHPVAAAGAPRPRAKGRGGVPPRRGHPVQGTRR